MSGELCVYCCARRGIDTERLEENLASSPEIKDGGVPLRVLWDQPSASAAYFEAINMATADVLIFAHCDVYFPRGWFERLVWEVQRLTARDPGWAVAGISSITANGDQVGRMFDSSLEPLFPETFGMFGKPLREPVPVISADELALIIRRRSGVKFDRLLPEFHLYGTDIILEAERQGLVSYGLDMPLIHNAKPQLRLGPDYERAYQYMVQKWRDRLPVRTTCLTLTERPFTLTIARMRLRYFALRKPWAYSKHRVADPGSKAIALGLERLLAVPLVTTE